MRIPLIAPVLLVMPLAFATRAALADGPSSVAIAVDTDSLAPKLAAEVQDGAVTHVLTGLTEVLSTLAGAEINLAPVSDAKTVQRIVDCEGVECLQDLARFDKVDLVVQVRVRPKQTTRKAAKAAKAADYLIAMAIARAAPEREAWTDKTDCQACDPRQIKHAASLLASTLAERIKIKRSAEPPSAETPPAPMTVTPPAPAPVLASKPLPPPPRAGAAGSSVPTYLSLTALVGGVLLMGSGGYLIHIDGDGTCDTAPPKSLCPRRYRTRGAGIGLLAGGGLAALGGLVGLVFFAPSSGAPAVALSFTGSSISVSGGF